MKHDETRKRIVDSESKSQKKDNKDFDHAYSCLDGKMELN